MSVAGNIVYFDSFAGVLPSPPPKKSSGDFDASRLLLAAAAAKKSNCILTVGDACAGCRSRGVSAGIRALVWTSSEHEHRQMAARRLVRQHRVARSRVDTGCGNRDHGGEYAISKFIVGVCSGCRTVKYTDRQASAMEKAKWKCTDEERAILEGVYRLNPAPDTPTKRKLAVQMRVAPRKIQTWFQNRRARERKAGARMPSMPPSIFDLPALPPSIFNVPAFPYVAPQHSPGYSSGGSSPRRLVLVGRLGRLRQRARGRRRGAPLRRPRRGGARGLDPARAEVVDGELTPADLLTLTPDSGAPAIQKMASLLLKAVPGSPRTTSSPASRRQRRRPAPPTPRPVRRRAAPLLDRLQPPPPRPPPRRVSDIREALCLYRLLVTYRAG